MPVVGGPGQPSWRQRTSAQQLALWCGWFALVALFVFAWRVMTKGTIWAFVWDAPRQAGDLFSRMASPRFGYLAELWWPL
jgi:phosphonate transport system permease protein